MTPLPQPSFDDAAHSGQLTDLIKNKIQQSGWISFADFMQLALYEPSLGYYTAGQQKFGKGGDFITAPEMTPVFAQTITHQIAQVLSITHGDILELGAGTGNLAVEILRTLDSKMQISTQYFILEVSSHLRQVQFENLQKNLPEHLMRKVSWLSELPASFDGVVIGNEVLDAIPVHIVHKTAQGICERGIAIYDNQLVWKDKLLPIVHVDSDYSPTENLNVSECQLFNVASQQALPENYITEFCPAATGLIKSLSQMLQNGVILMIDYGFSAAEYYHPQRNLGTLMCHYQQYAHVNPLINIGLQDITAHVDFTSIAEAGVNHGLTLSGFCSQAQFLINCGILECLNQHSPEDLTQYAPMVSAVQKLLSPAEMGDLFKVIALSKNIEEPLLGFVSGEKSHTL